MEETFRRRTRIGIKPENGDVCKWGCIDIDPRNYTTFSEKKVVDIIKRKPITINTSKI